MTGVSSWIFSGQFRPRRVFHSFLEQIWSFLVQTQNKPLFFLQSQLPGFQLQSDLWLVINSSPNSKWAWDRGPPSARHGYPEMRWTESLVSKGMQRLVLTSPISDAPASTSSSLELKSSHGSCSPEQMSPWPNAEPKMPKGLGVKGDGSAVKGTC